MFTDDRKGEQRLVPLGREEPVFRFVPDSAFAVEIRADAFFQDREHQGVRAGIFSLSRFV